MLLPKVTPPVIPGDAKSQRLAEKIAEARQKGEDSILAKMWAYRSLTAPLNYFDFTTSRHRDGPDDFFRASRCKVQGRLLFGQPERGAGERRALEFVAFWAHARRKFVEAGTYPEESALATGLIGALYDIETRGPALTWEARQELRQRESTVVLAAHRKWLDSEPLSQVLPKSDLADGVRYLRNHGQQMIFHCTRPRQLPWRRRTRPRE